MNLKNGAVAIQDLADRKTWEGHSSCRVIFLITLNIFACILRKILNVEIDNPPINLITIPLLLDFINLTKWAQDDEESTVLVLRSNVEGFFIAHFDVEALLSMDSGGANTNSSLTSFDELCLRFQKMNKVTICVIEGRVGGGGSRNRYGM